MTPPSGYAVVNYHGILPSDHKNPDLFLDGNLLRAETFRKQLRFLKSHYRIIHPEDFRAAIEQTKPLPARTVLLTCDDGLLNTLTDMLPVLHSEGVPCLFFITGASCTDNPGMLWYEELYRIMRIKPLRAELQLPEAKRAAHPASENFQSRWWKTVEKASQLDGKSREQWMALVRGDSNPAQQFTSEKRWRLLNLTELRQLANSGMSIGAHTLSHPVLSQCSQEEARREIGASKSQLEHAVGRPVWAFAYPFGNPATIGDRELRLARDAGFSCAFLNVEHWNDALTNLFALPRIHVSLRTTLPEFAAHLSGLHTRLQRAVSG